jgi:hypothetical protein
MGGSMGKVTVSARIENLEDLYSADKNQLSSDQVRRVEVSDALVDTGATMLSMPKRLIAELGLKRFRTRSARTTTAGFRRRPDGAAVDRKPRTRRRAHDRFVLKRGRKEVPQAGSLCYGKHRLAACATGYTGWQPVLRLGQISIPATQAVIKTASVPAISARRP